MTRPLPPDTDAILGEIVGWTTKPSAVRAATPARRYRPLENAFYLVGLNHWGYFAPHLLVVPLDGTPVLVTRAMQG